MNLDDFTPEQLAAARDCKTPAELHALANDLGHELSDDELDGIAGGDNWGECGSKCKKHYGNIGCMTLDSCNELSCDNFDCTYFEGRSHSFACRPHKGPNA